MIAVKCPDCGARLPVAEEYGHDLTMVELLTRVKAEPKATALELIGLDTATHRPWDPDAVLRAHSRKRCRRRAR